MSLWCVLEDGWGCDGRTTTSQQPTTPPKKKKKRTDGLGHEGRGLPEPPARQRLDQRGARRGDQFPPGAGGAGHGGDAEEEAEGRRGGHGEAAVGGGARHALLCLFCVGVWGGVVCVVRVGTTTCVCVVVVLSLSPPPPDASTHTSHKAHSTHTQSCVPHLAKREGGGVHLVDAEEVQRQDGAHGVDDGVHGAHLVEVDLSVCACKGCV